MKEMVDPDNMYKPSVFFGTKANKADPDQTPQNESSDQGLNCLLKEFNIKMLNKNEKKYLPTTLNA